MKVMKVASDNATSMAKAFKHFKPIVTLVLHCVITYLFISNFYMYPSLVIFTCKWLLFNVKAKTF